MKKKILLMFFLGISLNIGYSENKKKLLPNYDKDLISDESTAIKIAEAIWVGIAGEEICSAKPFVATSIDSVWTVSGTLPEGAVGGVPYIIIRKSDCKILRIRFTK